MRRSSIYTIVTIGCGAMIPIVAPQIVPQLVFSVLAIVTIFAWLEVTIQEQTSQGSIES